MKNIKNDIKTGEYKRVYLLYGKENYLKRLYANKLQKGILPEDDSMNMTVIQGDSFDLNEFRGMCDTMPFFADRRCILVNRSGKFKASKKETEDKPEKKSEGKEGLAEYISLIPDTTTVIFVEDEVDKRGKLFKAVKEQGYACEMNELDERDLILWIATEFRSLGKGISEATAKFLLEWSGINMENLKIEIEKLGFYALDRDSVEKKDIEAVCTKELRAVIFDMTDAVAVGDMKRALAVYERLNALKEPVQLTWRMLIRHYTQLLVVKELKAEGKSQGEITSILGIHPFAVQKLMQQVGNFKRSALRAKLEYGVQLEQDMKNGKIAEKNLVELFILG